MFEIAGGIIIAFIVIAFLLKPEYEYIETGDKVSKWTGVYVWIAFLLLIFLISHIL